MLLSARKTLTLSLACLLVAAGMAGSAQSAQNTVSVGGLAGLQMQNIVSDSFLHDRGEILYRPTIKLILDNPETVHFTIRNQNGEEVASFNKTPPAGSSNTIIDRGYFEDLPLGHYTLTGQAAGKQETVKWVKTVRGLAKKGSIGLDRMNGKAGSDLLAGDSGGDIINGNGGNDYLWGDTAPDLIHGGPGDDMIDGASAGDKMYGDGGNDTIYGGYGHDTIWGGEGDDSLDGSFATDLIWAGAGNDVIHGGGGSDTLHGEAGDDKIFPDSSADKVYAGEGNDTIYYNSGSGSGIADCGNGEDTLIVNGPGGEGYYSSRRMIQEGRAQGCEEIIWAETQADHPALGTVLQPDDPGQNLVGSQMNDRLLGNLSSETFTGFSGDDEIWANCCDVGQGKTSTDQIDAGDGDDTVYGGFGKTTILGGPGSDYLQGGQGAQNSISAGAGNDFVRLSGGNRGKATVSGDDGDDTVWAATSHDGKVTVSCGAGKDTVYALKEAKIKSDCERIKRY